MDGVSNADHDFVLAVLADDQSDQPSVFSERFKNISKAPTIAAPATSTIPSTSCTHPSKPDKKMKSVSSQSGLDSLQGHDDLPYPIQGKHSAERKSIEVPGGSRGADDARRKKSIARAEATAGDRNAKNFRDKAVKEIPIDDVFSEVQLNLKRMHRRRSRVKWVAKFGLSMFLITLLVVLIQSVVLPSISWKSLQHLSNQAPAERGRR